MRESFDISWWVAEVREKKPSMDALVALLAKHGAIVNPENDSHDVAALHYRAVFSFPGPVKVTVGIILMDWQTESDVVIETITTLPDTAQCKGFASKAVVSILQWAASNGFRDVRATQIRGEDNERFWKKNGFIRQEDSNPCNDFVYLLNPVLL